MFNKNLFYSLCDKYDVELSDIASKPMISDNSNLHVVTNEDIKRVFAPCQIFFGYSSNNINSSESISDAGKLYQEEETLALAC